jgi:D-alanyl-lipoteichoic acid acyltransferase DltB (MBOAT superfamily)
VQVRNVDVARAEPLRWETSRVDMAIGLCVRLPLNFDSPYRARSIQDFWRRWHITLSTWLRDYLYIPMGGNRTGPARTYLNLFVTFLLGGLWHGAAWSFVAWGALHGAGCCVQKAWQGAGFRLPTPIGILITFLFVNFGCGKTILAGMSAGFGLLPAYVATNTSLPSPFIYYNF